MFVPQLVCEFLSSQPTPASCQLHSPAQGQMNATEGVRVLFVTAVDSLVPWCTQNSYCSPALHCPCLAAAPAGMCLPANTNPCGMQSWQGAVVTGSALSSHDGNLQDPAPQRESPSPGAAKQPWPGWFPSAFCSKGLRFAFSWLLVRGRTCPALVAETHLWWSLQPLGPFPHMQTTSLFCLGLSAAAFLFSLATGSSDWQVTNNGTGKSDLVWSFCLSPMLLAFHPESCT